MPTCPFPSGLGRKASWHAGSYPRYGRWVGSCWPPLPSSALALLPADTVLWTCSHHPCLDSSAPTSSSHCSVKSNSMVLHMHKIVEMHLSMGPESYAVVLDCQKKKKSVLAVFVTQNISIITKNPSQPPASRTATCSTCCGPGGKSSIIFLTYSSLKDSEHTDKSSAQGDLTFKDCLIETRD